MSAEVFLDTNILVYAAGGVPNEDVKRRKALELIEREDFATSAQVLQEFFVTVVRKLKRPLPVDAALEWIEQLAVFPCQPVDRALVLIAVELSERFQVSYWDAAILAAAMAQSAHTVYSEDLNNGQIYETIRVVNPFVPVHQPPRRKNRAQEPYEAT